MITSPSFSHVLQMDIVKQIESHKKNLSFVEVFLFSYILDKNKEKINFALTNNLSPCYNY